MAETIAPVVHGGRRTEYWTTVALHALGATFGAAALGGVLGLGGAIAGGPWGDAGYVVLGLVASAYVLREAAGVPVPIPDRKRQVPDWWRTFYSPRVAAFLYGGSLGVGWLTYVSFGTFAAVSAAAFLTGNPLAGAALCAPFGLARGLSVTINSGATTQEHAAATVAGLERLARTSIPRAVNALVLVSVVGAATIAAVALP